MPALKLFGRRWNIASDDLPLVAIWPTAFHGAWAIILFASWLALERPKACHPGRKYTVALAGLGAACAVNFGLGVWIVCESLRGTIFEAHKRRKVPWLLYLFFAVVGVELGFLIYGTVVLQDPVPECVRTSRHLWSPRGVAEVLIWSTWAIMGMAFIIAFLAYNAFPDHSSRSSWERRCWCVTAVCCCQWGRGWSRNKAERQREPYARLAELFMQLFGHTDLVASDILAAFFMVAEWQREQRQHAVRSLLSGDVSDDDEDEGHGPGAKRSPSPVLESHNEGEEDALRPDGSGGQDEQGRALNGRSSGQSQADRSRAGKQAGHQVASREGSGTSRDCLWPAGSSSESYDSPGSLPDSAHAQAASDGSPKHREDRGGGPPSPHSSGRPSRDAGRERRQAKRLLTPTGIVAQLRCAKAFRPSLAPAEAVASHVDPLTPVDDDDVYLAAHFCNYAFAAYGYMLYIWSTPNKGWFYLCFGRWCGLWTGPLRRYAQAFAAQRFLPDLAIQNHMNHEAILQMSGIKEKDLAFVRFVGGAHSQHCLPYFIAVDHATNSVVIAIRGTLSLDDCLTDFMCEPADLEEWIASAKPGGLRELSRDPTGKPGLLRKLLSTRTSDGQPPGHGGGHRADNPPGSFAEDAPAVQIASRDAKTTAHSGMLDAAKAIVDDLKHVGVFESLLMGQQIGKHRVHHDCRGWGIAVTGHSLGAGAAVLVALYLRNYFQGVKCWAFEPPGGVADPYIAEAAKGFCTSCVLGKDWIPRLTIATFERLRDEMITAAATCRRNKTSFMSGVVLGRKHRQKMRAAGRSLFRPESELDPQVQHVLRDWRHSVHATKSQENRYHLSRSFRPPGRLLFLRPVKAGTHEKTSKRKYEPVWMEVEALMQEGILVSPRMMMDHMPEYLTAVLRRMARERGRPTTDSSCTQLEMEECDHGDPDRLDH